MSEKVGLRHLVLRYQGLFDFDGLYKHIVHFFEERHYYYVEKKWKEKDFSPLGRERVLKLAPYKKASEYLKYQYDIEWNNLDVHTVEVIRNGKTVKLTWARFKFKIHASIIVDWQGLGAKYQKTQKFFNEKVLKREIEEEHAPTLMLEEQRLLDEIKTFLHMEVTRIEK